MTEITKTENTRPSAIPKYVWMLFAAGTVFIYFFGLTIPLMGPDEPRYAQVAREMFGRGDWITPTLGGFNWFEKPALFYWLEIASYYIFGVNEFAARFGAALCGLGTIASLWILGKFVMCSFGDHTDNRQPTTVNFANWLALIAASTIGILAFSRGASFDIIITFPITAAMVSFFVFDQTSTQNDLSVASHRLPVSASPRRSVPVSLFLFYFFIGVALLAKGLIGIIFPFGIVALFYILSRRLPSKAFLVSLIWGTLLAVAVALVWYVPMYLRHDWPFIDEFFIQHHFQRFTSNKYQHPQPFYFFLWILPLMIMPWLPLFLAAIWNFAKQMFNRIATGTTVVVSDESPHLPVSRSPLLLFSFAWLAVPLVFFSLSGSKLPGYILPAVPAAIIITAVFVDDRVTKSAHWLRTMLIVPAATFAVSLALLIFALPKYAETDTVKYLIQTADERGFGASRVLTLHTVSYNAEFYAAGRLIRDADGKQHRFSSPAEVLEEIKAEGNIPVVVLIPLNHLPQLMAFEPLHSEILRDNGDLAIVAVSNQNREP